MPPTPELRGCWWPKPAKPSGSSHARAAGVPCPPPLTVFHGGERGMKGDARTFLPQSECGCRVALAREERRSGGAGKHVLSLFPPGPLQPCNRFVPGGRGRLWRVAPGPCNQAGASGRTPSAQVEGGEGQDENRRGYPAATRRARSRPLLPEPRTREPPDDGSLPVVHAACPVPDRSEAPGHAQNPIPRRRADQPAEERTGLGAFGSTLVARPGLRERGRSGACVETRYGGPSVGKCC